MHIRRFEFRVVRLRLKKTIEHASFRRRETDNIIVSCELDDGTVGWGEGLPRKYVTGDTIESVERLAREVNWSERLGDSFDDIAQCLRLLDERLSFVPLRPRDARTGWGNPLRCAVELSVLDAVTRRCGRPLSTVASLVPEAAALRTQKPAVQYSAVLTGRSPRRALLRGWLFRAYGFAACKVKVGFDSDTDAAILSAARRGLGPRFDIRVDANEAWDLAAAQSNLERLACFGISAVEQPLPAGDWDDLIRLRRSAPVPVMLDESLCSLDDGERAAESGAADMFNIRLSKCGGLIPSLRLAALAHRAGLGFQLGCQVGESCILSAAGRAFAATVDELLWCEGSFDRHLLRDRLSHVDITFRRGGRAPALTGPGLGIDLWADRIDRVTLRRHEANFR